jgi:hypothetical protein
MNDILEKDLKGNGRGLIGVLFTYFPGGAEINYEKSQSRQSECTEIRTKHPPPQNISTELYRYTEHLCAPFNLQLLSARNMVDLMVFTGT